MQIKPQDIPVLTPRMAKNLRVTIPSVFKKVELQELLVGVKISTMKIGKIFGRAS